MIRNRVFIAGVIFCLLFISILFVLFSNQDYQKILPAEQNNTTPHTLVVTDQKSSQHNGNNISSPGSHTAAPEIPLISGTGTVVYQDIEDGFYGVIATNGRQFLPTGLPADLRINGTKVSYTFHPAGGKVSMFMWGEPVDIISIKAISSSDSIPSNLSMVEYEKAGGVSGSYEFLKLYSDGRGEVNKWNRIQQINLTPEEIENLSRVSNISEIEDLKSEYMPASLAPDAITYTITLGNKSVKATGNEMPEQLKQLQIFLTYLLDKYTISPITANMTLEGTAWRLTSYIRPDGIPVILPNDSKLSAIFGKDMNISGSTGCNSYSGIYNQSGSNLSFGSLRVTQGACTDPGAMDVETGYLQSLGKIRFVTGKQRILSMADDNNTTLLIFDQVKR